MIARIKAEQNKTKLQGDLNISTNINSAIDMIYDSDFFTDSEKENIEWDLLYTGRSSILSNAGISLSF